MIGRSLMLSFFSLRGQVPCRGLSLPAGEDAGGSLLYRSCAFFFHAMNFTQLHNMLSDDLMTKLV